MKTEGLGINDKTTSCVIAGGLFVSLTDSIRLLEQFSE